MDEAEKKARYDEILKSVQSTPMLIQVAADMVELEDQLDMLRDLPKIRVHPDDPARQKATPAAKMYKEYLQQYINLVKVMLRASGIGEDAADSPLRKWFDLHVDIIAEQDQ